ncbi:MAG: hypothetical protein KatS3mg095_0312 [Candidatus Parcubacteria bacterium]|nr:MAG: hypothetical protein KatS3mg095_0312 [Candidatus Parcubacteria bacterium]
MIANIFFFICLLFILGIIISYYFKIWFIFILFIILIFFRYKFLIPVFCLSFLLGGIYLFLFQNLKENSVDNSIRIIRELPSTRYYHKYLGQFNGLSYFIYVPYYYEKLFSQDKITVADFEIIENKIFIRNLKKLEKSIFSSIYKFRDYINSLIDKNYSLITAEIIGGILYGREINEKNIRDNLKKSGLSHITAMSGYNLVILSLFINNLFKFLPLSFLLTNLISILVIFVFIIFTGFQSSVIRAGIMMAIFIISKLNGKPSLQRNVLIFTAFIISLFNPLSIINDLGFQLSILATIGIIYFGEFFNKFLRFKFLSETISAQILVLPLLWYKFGEFNIFSFLNNSLIVPIIPYLMLTGFLALILYFLYPINQVFNIPFEIFAKIISYLANLPKIYIPLSLFFVFVIYLIIIFLFFRINKNEKIDFNFGFNNIN